MRGRIKPAQRSPSLKRVVPSCLNPFVSNITVMSTRTLFLAKGMPACATATTGSGKVRRLQCLLTTVETRMSVVDITILILKLIVAALGNRA